jgi:hypothetical protein
MESKGIRKFCDHSAMPILYHDVGDSGSRLQYAGTPPGRVPFWSLDAVPLFLHSKSTSTTSSAANSHRSVLLTLAHCCTDHDASASDEFCMKGRNFYELHQLMWEFERDKPRFGDLSVTETEELQIAVTAPQVYKMRSRYINLNIWTYGLIKVYTKGNFDFKRIMMFVSALYYPDCEFEIYMPKNKCTSIPGLFYFTPYLYQSPEAPKSCPWHQVELSTCILN